MTVKKLSVRTEWCKGCGICEAFCPKKVLKIVKEKVHIENEADCIACGICQQHCPDYAIFLLETEVPDNG